MHHDEDGSVSFSAKQYEALAETLSLAEELTDQMSAEPDGTSENCEDRLLHRLERLKKMGVKYPNPFLRPLHKR